MIRFIGLLAFIVATHNAKAAPQTLEIATIIPDGTPAASALKDFSKAVDAQTNHEVRFKFKWGGSAGTDPDILSAITAGKFQGAMFAGQIMDQIAPIMRQGEIPFQFGHNRPKARAFVAKNSGTWNKALEGAGFHNVGFYEVGFVYLCGKKSVSAISDIKAAKIWLWPGDKLGRTVIDELKGLPVEIPVQDSFKAFADGRIEFAYAPAIALVALQWYTKANHVVADPISYATGAFIIDQKIWKALLRTHQETISKESEFLTAKLNEAAQSDENESLEALKSMGAKISPLGTAETAKLNDTSKAVAKKWNLGR
jgi:TRAP-type C4-dicarboxylate transport system substrate-binding protein